MKFNHDTGLFEPVFIDPALVKKYFPRFGTRPEGFVAPPRVPLPDE